MTLQQLMDTPPWEWPKDAKAIILATLKDRGAEAEDRLAAAELGGNMVTINDELAEALLAVAGNGSEEAPLRAMAAISLGPVLDQTDTDGFEDVTGMDEAPPISEPMFVKIKETLHQLFQDESNPKEVRRRIFEASLRASEDWHEAAIRAAYNTGDREWMLSAVFGMRWVQGFAKQILEALKSSDEEILYEAVEAAGSNELDAAWPKIEEIVKNPKSSKQLLIGAIGAVSSIRPEAAKELLRRLAKSKDEEIAEAAQEAISMAGTAMEFGDGPEDETEIRKWVN
jgi:hypothetical protein